MDACHEDKLSVPLVNGPFYRNSHKPYFSYLPSILCKEDLNTYKTKSERLARL